MTPTVSKNIRLSPDTVERADAVAAALKALLPVEVDISQTEVFRRAIERGLASMEAELGIVSDSDDKK